MEELVPHCRVRVILADGGRMLSANLMHSSSGKEIMRYRDRVLSNCRVMAGGQRAFLEALIVFRRLESHSSDYDAAQVVYAARYCLWC